MTPWTEAGQASLCFTVSWSLLKFMSIELVMLYNCLILCCPLLLLPSIFPSIRVFSSKYIYVICIFNYIFNAHHHTKRCNEKNLDLCIESPWNNSHINRLRSMCWLLGDSNPGAELHWYCDFPKQWTPLSKVLIEIKCDFPSMFIGIWDILKLHKNSLCLDAIWS